MLENNFAIVSEKSSSITAARAVINVNPVDQVVALRLSYLDKNNHRLSILPESADHRVVDVMTSHDFTNINYNDGSLEAFINKCVDRFFKRQQILPEKEHASIATWLIARAKEGLSSTHSNIAHIH